MKRIIFLVLFLWTVSATATSTIRISSNGTLPDSVEAKCEWIIGAETHRSNHTLTATDTSITIPLTKGLFNLSLKSGPLFHQQWLVADGREIVLTLGKEHENRFVTSIEHKNSERYHTMMRVADSLQQRAQVLFQLVHFYHHNMPEGGIEFARAVLDEFQRCIRTWQDQNTYWKNHYRDTVAWKLANVGFERIPNPLVTPPEREKKLLQNWFSRFNPADTLALNSPFFRQQIFRYLEYAATSEKSDSNQLETHIDLLLARAMQNERTYAHAMDLAWQWSMQNGHDDLAMYIDLSYQAERCGADTDTNLQARLQAYRDLQPGKRAPDIIWMTNRLQARRMYNLESEYTLIVFWATWCPHCIEQMPAVAQFARTHPDIHTIGIALEEDQVQWSKAVQPLKGITHLFAAGKWENDWVKDYAVMATPTFYLLDADKRILGKSSSLRQIKNLL
jgi:thiol-disulfide isomerase/thioredoxin